MLSFKRGKRRFIADYKFEEIYSFYKEMYKDEALSKEVVHEIYKKLFPEIVKLMVFENLDYRMPARLGSIRVRKKEVGPKIDKNGNLDTRNLSIDFKATKKLWEKLYPGKTAEEINLIEGKPIIRETNDYNGGYRLHWYWDKLTSNLLNQSAFYINMTRGSDEILSRGAKTNQLNFYC
jgi:hypothetical protein